MEFKESKLGELCEIKIGRTPPRKEKEWFNTEEDCLRWVSIKDMGDCNKYICKTSETVSKKGINKFNIPIIKKNTVILSFKLTIGRVAICNEDMISNEAIAQVPIKDITDLDYNYLYYYLKNYNYSELGNTSSIATAVNSKVLQDILVRYPSIDYQKKISHILSNIDKKMELNNKINDNLFEITKQLYKNWFIDFEFPNESGEPYKSSNGKMIESELGLIPENWTIKRLDEISINFDSKRKPLSGKDREERKGNIPYYGATSIIDYVNDYIFDDIYVLMGEDGSVINADNTPVLQYVWKKCWINNHAHVLQGKDISTEHLMECLRATDVSSIITGAVQLKINQANMNSLKYIYATTDINKKFDEIIDKFYKKIRKNIEENETLIQVRDTLLPKLMNGEIDLDKIEI